MTKILVTGYYGLGNIGDEAILSGMITSLKKYIENPNISVVTNSPEETRALHSITPVQQSFKKGIPRFIHKAIFDRELVNVKREIEKCDIFILGGGSLLQDLRVHYLPILLSLVKLAQRCGKKTVIYGIGAGPIDTYFGQRICRAVLNEADLVTVRDSMSKDVLEKCGVRNVIRTADPAFGINIPTQDIIDNYLNSMRLSNGEQYIATTAYNWLHDSDLFRNPTKGMHDLQTRRERLANSFEVIVNKYNQEILFVPTVKIDEDGYTVIKELMPSSGKARVLDYDAHFNAIFAALSCSNVLIGMRLHSLILATLMGVPVVPISYCGKVKSYLDLIGMEDLYLDVEDLGKEVFTAQLLENFDMVWEKRSHYINHQQLAAIRLRQKAYENAKLVADLL
jgi:polysaccharide pyruvyl transferase CsaB